MDYSLKEQKSDIIQLIAGVSLFSLVIVSQLFIFPMSPNISDKKEYFTRYYLILGIFIIIDIISSVVIMKNSHDYDKHKFLRRNVALISAIIFAHLFFIIPYIEDGAYNITILHWIVVFLAIIKISSHIKIFSIFQVSYKSLKPLE